MKQKPLRVALDVDGVLFYNPARVVRPLVVAVKKLFFKNRVSIFFIPHSPFKQKLWIGFHKSSLWIAPGFWDLTQLVKMGKIELYLITGRYSFLKDDLLKRINKKEIKKYIKKTVYNAHDEQPHLFKERVIRELGIHVYIEDNWDVIKHLAPAIKDTNVYWIDNILDHRIPYPRKHSNLASAVATIKKDFDL